MFIIMKLDIISKIEEKVHKYAHGCWRWQGQWRGELGREPDFQHQRKRVKVREQLYGYWNGIFPPKKVYRTCLNCLCVNPLHMSLTEDRRSLIAKLYDDEDHNQPAIDPDTGEIRRGFAKAKKTSNPKTTPSRRESFKIAPESQFFKGNEYGEFIQTGKELKYGNMEQRETDNAGEMDGFSEEI